jgi:hypothetical protein
MASSRLAFEEIRQAGAGSPQVSRRLKAALEDLRTVAPPNRRGVLDRELDLLEQASRRSQSSRSGGLRLHIDGELTEHVGAVGAPTLSPLVGIEGVLKVRGRIQRGHLLVPGPAHRVRTIGGAVAEEGPGTFRIYELGVGAI